MKSKTFKTIDEQLEILRNRGLVIDDLDFAKEVLLRENYFFLSGYRHLFLKSQKGNDYIEGTNFKEIYYLFHFDRQIRNILFKNLLVVENNMKSVFSYQLSKEYGYREKDYLRITNFNTSPEKIRQVNDLIHKMKRQIRVNGQKHRATYHYIQNYGYIPLWVVVKVLSFGIVSELFTILKYQDQKAIAEIYNIDPEDLITYLPILANYRNLCAHEDMLFDNRTQKCINDTKYHAALNIPIVDGEYIYGKNDIFSLIIILKELIRKDDFKLLISELSYEIDVLAGRLNTISIKKVLDTMGFPVNFKEILLY